ncbi:MAG TPA: multidrug effflux MFS transporter [Burkholderiaceae bacterium]|nr:multidrug effflux MFS transporter [Burkholderiaceae bacterium]
MLRRTHDAGTNEQGHRTTDSPGAPDQRGAQFAATLLLSVIAACLMLQPLSTDLYLASLPHLARYFQTSPAVAQQTLSLFVFGFAVAQLLAGPVSDRFGRRPVLLAGLLLYVVTSVVCAAAPSIVVLLAARLAQAVGCCTAVVIARAIVRDVHAPEEGARVVATATSVMALAPLLGPIAGGYLQVLFGWRAAFVVLAMFGAGLTLLTWRVLHETNQQKNATALQLSGLVRGYREILAVPAFWAYTLPGALSYGSIFVFISGAPFALTDALKMPTVWFGFAWAFGVSGFLTGTVVCRRLLVGIGIARTASIGGALSVVAGVLFAGAVALGLQHWATVVICQFLVMFAHGINWPCAQVGAVAPFGHRAATAAGLLGFFTMFSALLIGSWIGMSYNGTLYPMSLTSAAVGGVLFLSSRALARHRN